jgi:hypothetical protein
MSDSAGIQLRESLRELREEVRESTHLPPTRTDRRRPTSYVPEEPEELSLVLQVLVQEQLRHPAVTELALDAKRPTGTAGPADPREH